MKPIWKALLAILVFAIMQMMAGVLMAYIHIPMALSLIISSIVTILILVGMRMIGRNSLSVKCVDWRLAPLAIVGALFGIFAMDLLGEMTDLPNMMEAEFRGLASRMDGIIALAFAGPIAEEFVFREAVLGHLYRNGCSAWTAILLSALAFGLIHINPAQVPFAFVIGVILGLIRVKTGNIVLTTLIHILNNSIAVIEMNALGDSIDTFSYVEALGGSTITWAYIIGSTALCILFITLFCRKTLGPYRTTGTTL